MEHVAADALTFHTRTTVLDWAIACGRMIVVVMFLAISPQMLGVFGWQYYETGGNLLVKVHPATIVAGLLIIAMTLRAGNPLVGLGRMAEQYALTLPFLAANVYMMLVAVLMLKVPLTIFVETFVASILLFILFRDATESEGRRLAQLAHLLLTANALLGIYEVISGFRLTPLLLNGELIEESRATSLLGHPLLNAIITSSYILILAVGGGRDLSPWLKRIVFVIALISLVPFGGRAATAAAIVGLAYIVARQVWAVLRGAEINTMAVAGGLFAIPAAGLLLVAANELGALTTLTGRLVDDQGSADARVQMFDLFDRLSTQDLLLGPDPEKLQTWVRLYGLEFGIESFIVAFILNYGIIATAIFMPALAIFLYGITRALRPGCGLVIIAFMLVALTSLSLSAKSPILTIFVMMLTIFLRPQPAGTASPGHAISASRQRSTP